MLQPAILLTHQSKDKKRKTSSLSAAVCSALASSDSSSFIFAFVSSLPTWKRWGMFRMIFFFSFWSGIFGLFFNHKVAQSTFLSLLSSFRSGSSSPRRDSGGLLLPITAFFLTISWFSNKARLPWTTNHSFMKVCWVEQHLKAYLANVVRWGGPKTIANPEEEIIKRSKILYHIFSDISLSLQ